MTVQQRNARLYCESIGADPDEEVLGVNSPKPHDQPAGPFIMMPCWQWYIGAQIKKENEDGD